MRALGIGLYIITFLFVSSCGRDTTTSPEQEDVAIANSYLNKREYSKAISILEAIPRRVLFSENAQKVLVDSYLGECGMDALGILEKTKIIKSFLSKYKKNSIEKIPDYLKILELFPKPGKMCLHYMSKGIDLMTDNPGSFVTEKDRAFYVGNLFVIESFFLVSDFTTSVSVESFSKSDFEKLDQTLEKVSLNIDHIVENYQASYEKLSDAVEILEKVVMWKKELE